MSPDLKVTTLTKCELLEALDENVYWKPGAILIPKSKAVWLAKNSRITPNDICAVACTEHQALIAYVLTIPDYIQLRDGTKHKTNWLHEWWVAPKYQGTVVASFVFNKALKALKHNVLIESNGHNAETFFSTLCNPIYEKTRHTIFLKLNKTVLANKITAFKYLGGAVTLLNGTIVKLINLFNLKKTQQRLKQVHYEYLNTLDQEAWQFMAPVCQHDFVVKDMDYVNWHINNNQYLQTPVPKRFPFSFSTTGFSNNIHNHHFKVIKGNKVIGFVSYLFNMIEFNVRYFVVNQHEHYPVVCAALMEHALASGATYIITDNPKLYTELHNNYKLLFTYKQKKTTKAHKRLNLNFQDIVLTDRDGRFH